MTRLATSSFFFFNDTATTEIYTLSLHDALPISRAVAEAKITAPRRPNRQWPSNQRSRPPDDCRLRAECGADRKSTRLNSSHDQISYAVFCLKKKHMTHPPLTGTARRPSSLSLRP